MPEGQHFASRADGQRLARQTGERHLESRPGERHDERDARFQRVGCDRCGVAVLVAKFSPQHTSVQWSQASVRACAEFGARVAAGEQTALIDSCASLRDSIDRAVLHGNLEVSPP
jgi:hypothetical protein